MLLAEALKLLKDGKCVSRSSWTEEDGYLVLMQGMKHVWKIIVKPTPNAGNHIYSFEELNATDWEVYDASKFEEKKPVELGCVAAQH